MIFCEMNTHPPTQRSKRRVKIGAIGLALGGLAPMVTGIVGVWGYITRGYFISKTGERVDGPAGILMSVFFILAGLGMIGYAIWQYRSHASRRT